MVITEHVANDCDQSKKLWCVSFLNQTYFNVLVIHIFPFFQSALYADKRVAQSLHKSKKSLSDLYLDQDFAGGSVPVCASKLTVVD